MVQVSAADGEVFGRRQPDAATSMGQPALGRYGRQTLLSGRDHPHRWAHRYPSRLSFFFQKFFLLWVYTIPQMSWCSCLCVSSGYIACLSFKSLSFSVNSRLHTLLFIICLEQQVVVSAFISELFSQEKCCTVVLLKQMHFVDWRFALMFLATNHLPLCHRNIRDGNNYHRDHQTQRRRPLRHSVWILYQENHLSYWSPRNTQRWGQKN